MIIRKVINKDSKDIYLWRNDNQSILMSQNSLPIDKNTHVSWFNEIINNKNYYFFMGIINNEKIGVVRFDCNFKEKKSLVSINLNPQLRGKGLSTKLLNLSIKKFSNYQQLSLHAIIKKNNLKSKKIFSNCGFILIKKIEEYEYYLLDL